MPPSFRNRRGIEGSLVHALTHRRFQTAEFAWTASMSGAVDGSPAISGGLVVAGSLNGELAASIERPAPP